MGLNPISEHKCSLLLLVLLFAADLAASFALNSVTLPRAWLREVRDAPRARF